MGNRVFVSSTCFDLIDVRRELADDLRKHGLVPILSDDPSSGFAVSPDKNSIETCLVNLRTCDYVLVVLSQRYGGSLEKAGFEDISATHLEYREAKRLGVPTYVYVRDRLEADFGIWKKEQGASLSWVGQDRRILEFLAEVRELRNEDKGNWIWTFKDSVELKNRVRQDLQAVSGEAIIRRLIATDRCPYFRFSQGLVSRSEEGLRVTIRAVNLGTIAAIDAVFRYKAEMDREWTEVKTGRQAIDAGTAESFGIKVSRQSPPRSFAVEVTYGTMDGYRLADATDFFVSTDKKTRRERYDPIGSRRQYLGSDLFDFDLNTSDQSDM